jgi:hypothetical protein
MDNATTDGIKYEDGTYFWPITYTILVSDLTNEESWYPWNFLDCGFAYYKLKSGGVGYNPRAAPNRSMPLKG